MTRKDLAQIRPLKYEVLQQEQRARGLEEALRAMRQEIREAPSTPRQEMLCESCTRELAALREGLLDSTQRYLRERRRLMAYVEGLPSSEMRQVLTLRYVDGCSWVQVALRMGGARTADGVRVMHDRFFLGRAPDTRGTGH